jgi:site-specific recombinase XerD
MHRFFSKPQTLLRLRRGPLGDYLDRYAVWLSEQGFCRVHARLQLVQIADFSLWLDKRGLTIIDIQPATIDSFIEDRRRRVKPRAERSTLQRFLKLVRPEACTQVSPPLTASQILLQDFRRHFLDERGATQVSYLAFQPILLQFLSDCFPDGTIDCARLAAKDVIRFVRRHAYRHSPGRAKLLITALRVFLRYLRLRGNITSDLAASVPRVAMWSGSTIPKFLSPDQVRQALAQCDPNSAIGGRNYAILLLLCRLGFRADEVVRLTLDNIDWENGRLTFRGKGGHWAQMPLPADVGEAIVRYLQHGRPHSPCRRLFLRHAAPKTGFANSGAISTLVRRTIIRAGIDSQRKGSHLFRHSLATRMINEGSSFPEIAELLRHQSIETTNLYAKVDFQALRSIAPPWLGGAQ